MHFLILLVFLSCFSVPSDGRPISTEFGDEIIQMNSEDFRGLEDSRLYRSVFMKRKAGADGSLVLNRIRGIYAETFSMIYRAILNHYRIDAIDLSLLDLPQDITRHIFSYTPESAWSIVQNDLSELGLLGQISYPNGWMLEKPLKPSQGVLRSIYLFGSSFQFLSIPLADADFMLVGVTNAQYANVMGLPCPAGNPNEPVSSVSALEAADFIQKLNSECERIGFPGGFHLPSNEQWQSLLVTYDKSQKENNILPGFQVYTGVAEWTSTSRYSNTNGRVIRGEDWLDDLDYLNATRVGDARRRYFDVGFRVMRRF